MRQVTFGWWTSCNGARTHFEHETCQHFVKNYFYLQNLTWLVTFTNRIHENLGSGRIYTELRKYIERCNSHNDDLIKSIFHPFLCNISEGYQRLLCVSPWIAVYAELEPYTSGKNIIYYPHTKKQVSCAKWRGTMSLSATSTFRFP